MFEFILSVPALVTAATAITMTIGHERAAKRHAAESARYDRALVNLARKGRRSYVATMRRDVTDGLFGHQP